MSGWAGVRAVQVLQEDDLLFEAAAAEHAASPAAVADPGAVDEAGADAAQPAEVVQAGRSLFASQLDGSCGVLADETLNHTGERYNTCSTTKCCRCQKGGGGTRWRFEQ